jgi:hypothetical protein
MYILLFDGTERQSDCYVGCVTVEHIECIDSVQCATELYLTVITERQSGCYVGCVTVQHIECTDSVQCVTELYLQ